MKTKNRLQLLIISSMLGPVVSSLADIDHLAPPALYDNVGSTNGESGQTFIAVDSSFQGVRLYIGNPSQPNNPTVNELAGPAHLVLYNATNLAEPIEIGRALVVANGDTVSGLTSFYLDAPVPTTVGTRYFFAISALDGFGIGLRNQYASTYADGGESFIGLSTNAIIQGIRDLSFAVYPVRVGELSIRISQVELCWYAPTNTWVQLQYKSSLTTNEWLPLGTNWLQGTGTLQYTNDAVVVGEPQRFYRTVITTGSVP